jgi:hypothetical protein
MLQIPYQAHQLSVYPAPAINMVYKITCFKSRVGLANKNTKDLTWFRSLLAR